MRYVDGVYAIRLIARVPRHAETGVVRRNDGVASQRELIRRRELVPQVADMRGRALCERAAIAMAPAHEGDLATELAGKFAPRMIRPQDVRRDGHEHAIEPAGLVDEAREGERRSDGIAARVCEGLELEKRAGRCRGGVGGEVGVEGVVKDGA